MRPMFGGSPPSGFSSQTGVCRRRISNNCVTFNVLKLSAGAVTVGDEKNTAIYVSAGLFTCAFGGRGGYTARCLC